MLEAECTLRRPAGNVLVAKSHDLGFNRFVEQDLLVTKDTKKYVGIVKTAAKDNSMDMQRFLKFSVPQPDPPQQWWDKMLRVINGVNQLNPSFLKRVCSLTLFTGILAIY